MPIFDYLCPKCNDVTEVTIRLSDLDTVITCMDCNSNLIRQLGASKVRFKGRDWESPKFMYTPDKDGENK